jgi:Fic-DOC domain mobile mystery protein B
MSDKSHLDPISSVKDSTKVPLEMKQKLLIDVKTLGEVYSAEMIGITKAVKELGGKPLELNTSELFEFHKKALSEIWQWAGKARLYQTNIGVESSQINIKLKDLFDDVHFWITNKTYPVREIGIRMHHRIIFIHPFVDVNGRIGRLYTDIFLKQNGEESLSAKLNQGEDVRKKYIEVMNRTYETKDFSELIKLLS